MSCTDKDVANSDTESVVEIVDKLMGDHRAAIVRLQVLNGELKSLQKDVGDRDKHIAELQRTIANDRKNEILACDMAITLLQKEIDALQGTTDICEAVTKVLRKDVGDRDGYIVELMDTVARQRKQLGRVQNAIIPRQRTVVLRLSMDGEQ